MKKKISALVMGICMFFIATYSLTGCSVVRKNNTLENKKTVVVVGDTTLTKADIINNFYTYYQNNSNYFAYYDEATIEDSFYSYTIIKEIIKQKSYDYLYDADKNADGILFYTQKDEEEVLKNSFNYILSQITANEKAIYSLADYEDDDLPIWLRTEEEEEEDTFFEEYKSSKPEIEVRKKEDAISKSSEDAVKGKIEDLEKWIFEYVSATDDEGNETRTKIDEEGYIVGARNQARAEWIEGLVSNAKAAGTDTTVKTVIENELVRVYNAYYDTKVQALFQNYFLQEYLTDTTNGDKVSLSDKAIVKAYLEKYYSDMQVYQVENNYISALNSKEGTSLVFYNYNGRNYFFTVQHILVKYDDYMTGEVSKLPGYGSGTDYDGVVSGPYKEMRDDLTNSYAMLTNINKDVKEQFGNSLEVLGDYYYFDETHKGDETKNFGYIKLKVTEVDGEFKYYRTDREESAEDALVAEEDVLYMATAKQVVDCYNANLNKWKLIVDEYLLADEQGKKDMKADTAKGFDKVEYLFDTIDNLNSFGKTKDEIMNKLSSLLFVELQWVYSSDTLGNELSNKLGYVVSNYTDENGSWVADFAIGARELMKGVETTGDNSIVNYNNMIISDYGYHIIKIENVYPAGDSLVDMSSITEDEIDLEDPLFIEKVANLMKQTYVSTSSNQTVYDYFYDEIYNGLIGTADSNGTYYTKLQYEWYNDYLTQNKINVVDKLTYEELMEAIN